MTTSAIVGAQYGSEGKGKIAAVIANQFQHAVRTGGPNSGHTVWLNEKKMIFRHIPCAAINPDTALYLGAGAIIDLSVLGNEIKQISGLKERLKIDRQAVIIRESDINSEEQITDSIGSTGRGVGSALLKKISRTGNASLACNEEILRPFISEVSIKLNSKLKEGQKILLEGTQGTGLSIHHGEYPFVTSRDVTAGSLCGEAGVSPMSLRQVILVVRSYPIRVAGESGPLMNEISWSDVRARSGAKVDLTEYTTVTGMVRRVGEFDMQKVKHAAEINGATEIALTFIDHISAEDYGKKKWADLSTASKKFIQKIEDDLQIPVKLVSTGPRTEEIIMRTGQSL